MDFVAGGVSRIKTGSWCTIQGISLDTLCQISTVMIRGLHASYQPRSKLNLGGENMSAARLVSGVIYELNGTLFCTRVLLLSKYRWRYCALNLAQTERPVYGIIHEPRSVMSDHQDTFRRCLFCSLTTPPPSPMSEGSLTSTHDCTGSQQHCTVPPRVTWLHQGSSLCGISSSNPSDFPFSPLKQKEKLIIINGKTS